MGNEVNCLYFNLPALNCAQCVTGYELDYKGICQLIPTCRNGYWNNQGVCSPMPPNCVSVDNKGLCTSCVSSSYKVV